MEEFVGPHCKELGINRKALDDALADNRNLSALCRRGKLSKGIVFELMVYERVHKYFRSSIRWTLFLSQFVPANTSQYHVSRMRRSRRKLDSQADQRWPVRLSQR
eukprot:scpid104015/ scgid18645/ 